MKTPSTKLFELIHKLTPSEKRYFKRFGLLQQQKNANKYTLLFNAINNQKKYDELALLHQFRNYDFINNFSEIKKYLFQQIQKALRNFHAQNSVEIILYSYLSDISILYNKALYEECNRLIKKAKKIALKHERWNILLLLNEAKRNVIKISHNLQALEDYFEKEIESDQQYMAYIENELEYFNKSLERALHLRKFGPEIVLNSKLKKPNEQPLTFRAQRYLLLEKSIIGTANYDADQIYNANKIAVDLFEANPHFIEAMPNQYVVALANMQEACKEYKYTYYFDLYMNKALAFLEKHPFDPEFKTKEILFMYILKCAIYTQRNDITQLQKVREELQQKIIKTKQKHLLGNDLACYAHYYLLRAAITIENYEEAIESYNDFLQLNLGDYRSDLQIETKILGLIPHFELGNWILLDSLTRSAARLIQRKHKHFVLGKTLIDAIRKCIADPTHTQTTLHNLQQDINQKLDLKRQNYYFVFLGWVESKISQKSIAESIQKKLSENII